METKDELIDVSVLMTTYGHEDFILEAIVGVLNQKFNGNIELTISNDSSPDQTHELIEDFMKSIDLPTNIKIRYVKQEKNLGAINNFLWLIDQVKGEFIAICEGDDFWSNPYKLDHQVDFLRNNEEYSIVFSNVQVLIESGKFNQENELKPVCESREYKGEEILADWIAHTSTFLIRNSKKMSDFSLFFKKHNFMYGDTPLFLYALSFGKGYGMKEYTSTYRRHQGGLTNQTQNNHFFLKFIDHLKAIKNAYDKRAYNSALDKSIKGFYMRLYFNSRYSDLKKYFYLTKALKYDKLLFFNIIKEKLKRKNILFK